MIIKSVSLTRSMAVSIASDADIAEIKKTIAEKVDVPPKKIPYFKMGKELKALLNSVASSEEPAVPTPEGQ